ncbi:hypothetical protein HK096_002159 [Nowakowskiella sp. JEL0078]|nr:hypothetical protein HK096_002159 [Nowakowskiella sp. JEL0078]
MTVNHFAHVYLILLLLDALRKAGPGSRIVNVASDSHFFVFGYQLDWSKLGRTQKNSMEGYSESKLMNVLFTQALARRLEGSGILVNATHPGMPITEGVTENVSFGGRGSLYHRLVLFAFGILGSSSDEGALSMIYAAGSPEVQELKLHGRYIGPSIYFSLIKPSQVQLCWTSSLVSDVNIEKCWEWSMDVLKEKIPGWKTPVF